MKTKSSNRVFLALFVCLALVSILPALAQDAGKKTTTATRPLTGQREKIMGVILNRDGDSFMLREMSGTEMPVHLTPATRIMEKKGNPFRGAHKYSQADLLRGLVVEVEGRGDQAGGLTAEKIRFTNEELMASRTVESRVTPVEGQLKQAEQRLGESEENAKRMSGQIDELNAVSNAARGGAIAAQQTADTAVAGVNAANERITSLDDYEPAKTLTVRFKVGSARLSDEAKQDLDQMAQAAKEQKGFVIQVAGFASSEGGADYNRRLSEQRADAVVRYLVDKHDVPLRRIVTPFGFGTSHPVAENKTRKGRQENRRVEVTLLVSRGLNTTPASMPGRTPSSE